MLYHGGVKFRSGSTMPARCCRCEPARCPAAGNRRGVVATGTGGVLLLGAVQVRCWSRRGVLLLGWRRGEASEVLPMQITGGEELAMVRSQRSAPWTGKRSS